MSASIEVETKFSIEGEAEFRRFLAAAGTPASVRKQLNGYLDGPGGELDRMGWMARIRLVGDETFLTLKGAAPEIRGLPDGVFRALEIERRLPWADAASCFDTGTVPRGLLDPGPEAPPEVRDFLGSGRGSVVAWSLTIRWTFRDPGRPDLIADETWFPDGSRDFEVEVEWDDVTIARRRAEEIARAAGVVLTPQTMTKHARANRHRQSGVPAPIEAVTRGRGR